MDAGVSGQTTFRVYRLDAHSGHHCHTDVAVMPAVAESPITATGTIELHLTKGRVCLTGAVDPGALRMVLEHLSA